MVAIGGCWSLFVQRSLWPPQGPAVGEWVDSEPLFSTKLFLTDLILSLEFILLFISFCFITSFFLLYCALWDLFTNGKFIRNKICYYWKRNISINCSHFWEPLRWSLNDVLFITMVTAFSSCLESDLLLQKHTPVCLHTQIRNRCSSWQTLCWAHQNLEEWLLKTLSALSLKYVLGSHVCLKGRWQTALSSMWQRCTGIPFLKQKKILTYALEGLWALHPFSNTSLSFTLDEVRGPCLPPVTVYTSVAIMVPNVVASSWWVDG